MIAVLCALALAVAAAKVAAGEAAMRLHNLVAGWFAALLVLLVAFAVVRWFLFPGRQLPRNRVRVMRARTRLGLRPGPGWATAFELWLRWGRWAVFRSSRRARPSLSAARRWARPSEHSVGLGRAHGWRQLRAPSVDQILVMAPPQVGKTGLLADWILTWPGAVLATSTKPDLFALTSGIRQRPGFFALPSALPVPGAGPFPLAPGIRQRTSPVHVFNPQSIGSTPSTFGWDPLPGCEDPATAIRRADAFAGAVDQSGVEGGGWFGKRAGAYMRALFCAAALDSRDMTAVSGWALSLEIREPQEILRRHGRERWALELGQLRGEAKRTIETIQITMTASLGFMNDPRLLQCVLPAEGFDLEIPSFLRERGTLYLVGRMQAEDAPLAPLFAALAGEIHYQGVLLASMQPGGRLDPPLLMALDEATQICPVPVPTWVADSGGQGITIVTVCHGEAPLVRRWGEAGKQTILDCSQAKIFLSGISAPPTLEMISKLAGDAGYTEAGQEHTTRHPIATEAMARQIPAGHEMVIRADRAPVIARTPRAWRNWRFLWARVTRRTRALVQAVPAVAATSEHLPAESWSASGEFRPAPVSPDTPHPWNKAHASKGPNGNGRQRNSSGHAGGTHDGH